MVYARLALALALTVALACDPAEPSDTSADTTPGDPPADTPEECLLADDVRASFSLDLGDWLAAGDDLEIDSACTVDAVGSQLAFQCDDAGQPRPVKLTLATVDPLAPPLQIGDAVTLAVRREATAAPDRGFWTLRDGDGQLLLAGARSFSSVPASAPDFFAPLTLDVDFTTCPEQKTDGCKLEQRLILAVTDAGTSTRIHQGSTTTLPSGLELLVERAQLTMASADAKTCPIDENTPETYQFLVTRPPA